MKAGRKGKIYRVLKSLAYFPIYQGKNTLDFETNCEYEKFKKHISVKLAGLVYITKTCLLRYKLLSFTLKKKNVLVLCHPVNDIGEIKVEKKREE